MKYLITFLLLTTVLFGKNLDSLTFSFINQYRIKKLVTISGTTEERISTIKETIFG